MEQGNEYRVTVSKKAADMLISHAAFLAQVSEDSAEHLTQEFEIAANSLEVMPQRCPWLITATAIFFLKNAMLSFSR